VSCQCCHELVYVPEASRLSIESQRTLSESERKDQTLVRSLLTQPRAAQINRMIFAFFALSVINPYLALWGVGRDSYSLAITSYCALHGVYQLIRRQLARRVAFRSLLFLGKATRLVGEKSLLACPSCGALLPANESKEPIVRCVYCNEPALFAVDLPWRTARLANARHNLGAVLSTITEVNDRCNCRLVQVALILVVSVPILISSPPW